MIRYRSLLSCVGDKLSNHFSVVYKRRHYVYYIQGEADATAVSDPVAYQAALEALIDTVDTAYNIDRFCVYQTGLLVSDQANTSWANIRAAQTSAVASKAKAIMVYDKAASGTTLATSNGRWVSGHEYVVDGKHWTPRASGVVGIEDAYTLTALL